MSSPTPSSSSANSITRSSGSSLPQTAAVNSQRKRSNGSSTRKVARGSYRRRPSSPSSSPETSPLLKATSTVPKGPSPLSHQLTNTSVASTSTSTTSLQTSSSAVTSPTILSTTTYGTLDSPMPASHSKAPHFLRQPHHQRTMTPRQDPTAIEPQPPKRKLRSKLLFLLITLLLAVCVYASFVDDFMGDVEAAISCGACIGLLVPLQALAHVGDDAFVEFFVGFCTKLRIEDADVCAGAIGTQAPILAHDLRSISLASHAAKNFCSTVFGLCPLQKAIPFTVQFLDGSNGNQSFVDMELTSGRKRKAWSSKGRKPFQVVHLSDVHVDRSYQEGADTTCSKVICCRNYGAGSMGPNVQHPAGKFGNKHCDAPPDLVDSMFGAIDSFVPNRSFTIFTGDVVESAVWLVNEPNVTKDLHLWHSDMSHAHSPAYPAIGNHDVAPVNAFPRSTTALPSSLSSEWVFDLTAKDWEKWIGKPAAEQVRKHYGCYSRVHPGTDLRIISLNTNYWYKQNFWLYDHDEPLWDPNGILTWLSHELHATERAGQRAWIIGHMPFGKVDALRDQSNYASQIFNRYHDTIAAHFYGHSHVDEFEISYPNYDNRTEETAHGIAYISGALTPASGNPVFRVYDVDPDTYEIMDFVPYYTNKSDSSFQIQPEWKPYYSARTSYGEMLIDNGYKGIEEGDSLDGRFWHRVTELFEKNETVFQLFTTRLSRGGKVEDCTGSICKSNTICMLRSMRSESNCAVIQPGLSFKDQKRDTEAVTEPQRGEGEESFAPSEEEAFAQSRQHDFFACEGAGLGSMLRKIAEGGFQPRQNRGSGWFGVKSQEKPGHLEAFEGVLRQTLESERKKAKKAGVNSWWMTWMK